MKKKINKHMSQININNLIDNYIGKPIWIVDNENVYTGWNVIDEWEGGIDIDGSQYLDFYVKGRKPIDAIDINNGRIKIFSSKI